MSYNLQPIGALPHFRALQECYKSDEGFILSRICGGPKVTGVLNNEFEFREDDVFVVSFPKTGTTWLQEIVYLIGTNLDYETARAVKLYLRFPYLEFDDQESYIFHETAAAITSPRFLKFHYPYSMLPKPVIDKKCKILCPIRNPKDTLVSYYHFSKVNPYIHFDADFATYFDMFMEGEVPYGPYWKHVTEFWKHRHDDNILIVKYEDMIKDILAVVQQVCKFLQKSYSVQQLQDIIHHCSFEEMKSNASVNPDLLPEYKPVPTPDASLFMRKGQVGDWKNYFTEEMNTRMDDYIARHLDSSGLKFTYELE